MEENKQWVFIREAMERHNVTAQDIAEQLNTSTQNVYYLMREGGTQTKISSLISIAGVIGCDLKELFTSPEEYMLQKAQEAQQAASDTVNAAPADDNPLPVGISLQGGKMTCPHCGKTLQLCLALC